MASQADGAAAPANTDPAPAPAVADPSAGQTTASQAGSKFDGVTKQVRSIVHNAADSASSIVSKLSEKLDKAVDKATAKINLKASDIQQNLTRSLNFPVSSQASNPDQPQPAAPEASSDATAADTPPAFPMSIMTWCSSLCGGSKNAAASRGLDASSLQSTELFRNVAGQFSAAITDASTKLEAEVQEVKKTATAQIDATSKQTQEQLDAVAKQTAAPAAT